MISVRKVGFTIIEVMLFLAISGLLFAGIIFGTGSSINIQRYRDSVNSLQSILQQQFTEVTNVINDNTSVDCAGTPNQNRGQTNCVVLGRFITYSGGNSITIKNVIGSQFINNAVTSDVSTFLQYNLTLTPFSTYDLEWNTLIKNSSNSPMSFSILMLRSPLNGAVRSFVNNTTVIADGNVSNLLTSTFLDTSAQLCVDPNGLTTNKQTEVFINKGASNAAAVETIGDGVAGYVCH